MLACGARICSRSSVGISECLIFAPVFVYIAGTLNEARKTTIAAEKALLVTKDDINAGSDFKQSVRFQNIVNEETVLALNSEYLTFVFAAIVIYTDVFGKTRRTIVRMRMSGDIAEGNAAFIACGRNNRST